MANLSEKTFLADALKANHFIFSDDIQEKFLHYVQLLKQWNRVYNLTAIHDFQDIVYLHLLDSLSISPYLHGERIIDVGTGAGLPGVPLALVHPEKQFVLLDSNSKKTRFLLQVVIELKIKNIEVVHSRCETYFPQQKFDSVLSRAFASLQLMLSHTSNLIAKGGQFLAMKGIFPHQEIQDLSPPFKLMAVHKLIIHGLSAERHLVCLEKETR